MSLTEERELATHIGQTLARIRLERNFTQEQVAERLDVTVETISRFERGAVLPSVIRLFALADVFSVSVSQLLQNSSTRQSDLTAQVVESLERLNHDDQVWVGNWLTQLCERLNQRRPSRKR
ncbi:helix-turn-helix domain-containing protein [Paraburkholderia sp. UCT31]|uniref:helix-turn-helix domain-containing protein n=1 Tax=Paraburkholderia sp. UCT31 TaxID=2615209 RepID=UPI0039753F74